MVLILPKLDNGSEIRYTHVKAPIAGVNTKEQYIMGKDDIKAAIEAKKALMAAELNSKEKRGYITPSFVGGARNDFEALSNIKTKVSGKKYASDALVSKYGRS